MEPVTPGQAVVAEETEGTERTARGRSGASLAWLFRRFGPLIAIVGGLVALKYPAMYDLEAYLAAAKAVAAGASPYAATRAMGVEAWGVNQVFISPPFVAHVLAPFSSLPTELVFVVWTVAGVLAVLAATRLVAPGTLVARAPFLAFCLVYVWGSLILGQVNLFTLAGLLLAFGSRSDRVAGMGLALAIVTRAVPGAFAVVLLFERRWRALAWAAAGVGAAILVRPADWVEFVEVVRQASGLPTLQAAVVQTSLAPYPVVWGLVAAAVVAIVGISALTGRDRALVAGTAIGLALVLLPTNAWQHWLAFALAPLLLFADDHAWSRRVLVAFVIVSFIAIGWPTMIVATAAIAVILAVSLRDLRAEWPRVRPMVRRYTRQP
jgi:hypothetical protein